ncbi:MAG: flagellar biosynthesis protein FliQ [Helicobacteraceae bacterium]|nr:flagellar biosynthesis protein FliQ [Helicobacteraceae bacterium]
MEAKFISLAIETYKITLLVSLPLLLTGLIVGLLISIFQATTQINDATLTFIPKILAIIAVLILTMPWMLNMITDYTRILFEMIPNFPF